MKFVPASIKETAFNCPHCGTLTTQTWFKLSLNRTADDHPTPLIIRPEGLKDFNIDLFEDPDLRSRTANLIERLSKGLPIVEKKEQREDSIWDLWNVNVSKCYECKKPSIWIYDQVVYPAIGVAPPANDDMPEDIRRDYDEASVILGASPRGAAALIRLAIDKLCGQLGDPKKKINENIADFVKDGLDVRIQRALDVVRVIGNNAVHPGVIDLRDDRATAESLFRLLNVIVDKMISEPKHIDQLYESLPAGALLAIQKRDIRK